MKSSTKIVWLAVISMASVIASTAHGYSATGEDLVEGYRPSSGPSVNVARSPVDKYPIVIPSAAELRKMLKNRKPQPKKAAQEQDNSGLPKNVPLGDLSQIRPVGREGCDRAIPTREEFRRMLKRRPADARQIMTRCDIDTSTLSPIRQLPVGVRQLPEDTRQRPVGTWGR